MLNEFIEKIIVHESDKSTGKRVQQIDIHLNFIGMFDTPVIEITPTPEQIEAEFIEAEQKYITKRTKDRERLRRWREQQKAKPMTVTTVT